MSRVLCGVRAKRRGGPRLLRGFAAVRCVTATYTEDSPRWQESVVEKLIGQIDTLSPDAGAGIRVISYFDSLVDGHAGFEAFLQGAAILTGCPVGVYAPCQHMRLRVDSTGLRTSFPREGGIGTWPSKPLGYSDDVDCRVWLERQEEPHAIDQIVLERLAQGLRLTIERNEGRLPENVSDGVEILLDATVAPGERIRAANRLHLTDSEQVRAVALPAGSTTPGGRTLSAIMTSPVGIVRAVVEPQRRAAPGQDLGAERRGIGPWVVPLDLPVSWRQAVVSLRLATAADPVVRASQLGSLAYLAEVVDRSEGVLPEVVALRKVIAHAPWALATLEAFSENDSIRSAASALGIHHSTAQARCETLEQLLGYELRAQVGRCRLFLDLRLYRLSRTEFL